MKLINAFWEERNTGLKTCEIVFEKEDSINDYLVAKVEDNYRYSVVKIPSNCIKLVNNLEELGYRYIETQFNISVASTEIERIDKKWLRVIKGTGFKRLENKNDLEVILSNVGTGMFDNDRITLDENLGKDILNLRYTNWIKDLNKDENTEIFYLTKYSKNVGFFIIQKNSENILHSIIAGIFKDYQGHGLSFALIYYYLKLARERNAKSVYTSFSSNNLLMLNTFTKTVPFKTIQILYVLRKFIKANPL
jgi:GNAT superfamily N-acetyltransferase